MPDPAGPVEPIHALIRVWVADRPGALGLVASRIGALRGDIVSIDVLERGEGVAIDEFAVNLPSPEVVEVLVREIEQVDGASVEQVRLVDHYPDARIDALESAAGLCEAANLASLHSVLVDHVHGEFLADWTALVTGAPDHLERLAAAGDAPDDAMLHALVLGTSASEAVASGASGPDDLALAHLPNHEATLLAGRGGPPFRRLERAQLLALARIADRTWTLLDAAPETA